MFKERHSSQSEMILHSMEELVPSDHLLRKIRKHIDFSFINPLFKDLYCLDNGRNCVEPELLMKMVFLQHLFGIKSFRQTCQEIEVNVAYRWFLDLPFSERVPHHSTLSQNIRRRFLETNLFEVVFDEILKQAIKKRLITADAFFTDSTHIKANANKRKSEILIQRETKRRREQLEHEINQARSEIGKEEFKFEDEVSRKEIKTSTTDPESGYYHRSHKEEGFMYLDHRTVDGAHNIIVDAYITKGNVHDSQPYLERLEVIESKYQLRPKQVGLDSGYYSYEIMEGLESKGIFGVIGYRRFNRSKEMKELKRQFTYDQDKDFWVCPVGIVFPLRNIDKLGYKVYHKKENCRGCPLAQQCLQGKDKIEIRQHLKQDAYERNRQRRLSSEGKKLYSKRKETIERSFAESKQNHGYRYATYRGLKKVQANTWMSCAAQNMKKMSLALERREKFEESSSLLTLISELILKIVRFTSKTNKIKSWLIFEPTLSTL
ncbi:MAG TPA: IS1182 family transposase [Flavobacterium sp.]|nr:IS1182 family transposase [Flavobacterium sp.]